MQRGIKVTVNFSANIIYFSFPHFNFQAFDYIIRRLVGRDYWIVNVKLVSMQQTRTLVDFLLESLCNVPSVLLNHHLDVVMAEWLDHSTLVQRDPGSKPLSKMSQSVRRKSKKA